MSCEILKSYHRNTRPISFPRSRVTTRSRPCGSPGPESHTSPMPPSKATSNATCHLNMRKTEPFQRMSRPKCHKSPREVPRLPRHSPGRGPSCCLAEGASCPISRRTPVRKEPLLCLYQIYPNNFSSVTVLVQVVTRWSGWGAHAVCDLLTLTPGACLSRWPQGQQVSQGLPTHCWEAG